VVVELHPGRAALLRQRFPGVTVVQADAVSLQLPGRPFRVVASPPYEITGALTPPCSSCASGSPCWPAGSPL
jgi:23S rRNA (adenine-N6)-dimethyltransferase